MSQLTADLPTPSSHETETLSDDLRRAWLRISGAEVAPLKTRALLETYGGDPSALLSDREAEWAMRVPSLSPKQAARLAAARHADVERELMALEKMGAWVVPYYHAAYPVNLRPVPEAAPVLYARGTLVPDDKFAVAVVGSRRATSYGLSIAQQISREMARRGLCVVSGGARGIDTAAHRGALSGGGRTLAFVGAGIDVPYPADNRALFDEIARTGNGAILSEFIPGTTPEPWRFPARNRLISGASLGVVVIESPVDSGALLTATEAAQQGREVFAVPGPIGTGRSAGCHRLIKEGAKLVEDAQDIFDELGLLPLAAAEDGDPAASGFRPAPLDLSPDQRQILDLLTLEAQTVDALIVQSRMPAARITGALTLLELRGLARRVPGNAYVRAL